MLFLEDTNSINRDRQENVRNKEFDQATDRRVFVNDDEVFHEIAIASRNLAF